MSEITIRRLDPTVIDGLNKRAAAAGRSMEDEARTILSEAVTDDQLARQRAGLKRLIAARQQMFGQPGEPGEPDSTALIRDMRDARTAINETWLPPTSPKP
jgi:plasmid stability protein